MKRTKLKPTNSLSSDSRNIGTQTKNFDNLIEIAKLEEQVRMLQLENDILRKHAESSNKPDNIVHRRSTYLASQTAPKIKSPLSKVEKSCSCKGNCSSRICGCVKKNNKCNLLCKCDDKVCQNQKLECDKENKENVNKIGMEISKNRKKNKVVETKTNKGLFNPVTELHKVLEEDQFSGICFDFSEKDASIKNLQTDLGDINNVTEKQLKENEKEKKEESNEELQELTEQVLFKPRHQLSRTPPNKTLEKSLEIEYTIQSQSHFDPTEELTIMFPVQVQVKEEKIDWEQHTAQLIPCKKCKRTFLPNRIQKHEACCKKV